MRILIVSCSTSSTEQYFLDISSHILKIINTQNTISDTQLVVIQRNCLNLVDYLYQLDTSHINPLAIHNFQAIDLFFVVGNRNVHPWNEAMWNVNCLIRMCLRLKRCLMLVSGCGFESLVFQLSCGFIGNVTLINRGVQSNEIKGNEQQSKQSKKTDLFLDEIEGILYAFNFETNEWYKKRDCGLQNHHKMEEVSRKSRYLVVRQKKRPLMMIRNIEEECQITTNHILFKNIPNMFMVEYISKWRANPFNCNFKILAHTALGPSVIQFENIVGIQFRVNAKYPATLKILENFILRKLQSLFTGQRKSKISSFTSRQQYDKPSLSLPFRRIDNLDCPLPKIQFMNRLKKSTTKQKIVSRQKVLSVKSSVSNSNCENVNSSNDWWVGQRVSVLSKKPLFCSKAYKTIQRQFDQNNKKINKRRQLQFVNIDKLQYYQPHKYMKKSNTVCTQDYN